MAYSSALLKNTALTTSCPIRIERLQGELFEPNFSLVERAEQAIIALYKQKVPALQLPQSMDDLEEIEAHATRIRGQSDTLVVVGIGGSSLGAKALTSIADPSDHMQFKLMDNPDPVSIDAMLNACDPNRTSWLFISKSGGTIEILSQVIIILQWLEERIGKNGVGERCVAITETKDSPLTKLATHYNIPMVQHVDMGGRWAALSSIGLLPAASCGVDIRKCRQGADALLQHALTSDILSNQPMQGALFIASNYHAHRNIHVVMPYGNQLGFTEWYSQLLSESLGKDGKGITPLIARGAVDQHSMMQLMLDGPDDKFFTIITSNHAGRGARVDAKMAELCGLGYLAGQSIGNVLEAFQEGTIGSIEASGRPLRAIHLPEINAYNLGALMMYFMLETLYIAELLHVNPFDQPAVEDSKVRAKSILNKYNINHLERRDVPVFVPDADRFPTSIIPIDVIPAAVVHVVPEQRL